MVIELRLLVADPFNLYGNPNCPKIMSKKVVNSLLGVLLIGEWVRSIARFFPSKEA